MARILEQLGSEKQTFLVFEWSKASILSKLVMTYMSPVSPVFHPVVTVSIELKNVPRVRASIL